MMKYLQAEKLKFHRSPTGKLVLMMPLISVFAAAVLTSIYFTIDSYNWWYMILFPGTVALFCGMIGRKDGKQNNRTILSLPVDTGKIWDAKVGYGVYLTGIASFVMMLASLLTEMLLKNIMHISFVSEIPLQNQFAAALILWISFLWQVPFCLLLYQVIGLFPMLLIHMASYMVLSATVSLTSYYMLAPGALSARMMCAVLGILPNGLPAMEGQMTFFPKLLEMQSLWIGLPVSLLWFAVLWLLGRQIYKKKVMGK